MIAIDHAFSTLTFFYVLLQSSPVDEAMLEMRTTELVPQQPILFRAQDSYYVKADNLAIPVNNCGCFADAFQFLFMCFHVFNVTYPHELRYFYGFFEHLFGIKLSIGKCSMLNDLLRKLVPI